MIEWTKLPSPECFTQDPSIVYVVPCEDGSKIWLNGKECFVENASVIDIIDKFNSVGCTSFQLSKDDVEHILSKLDNFTKGENND